MLVGKKKKSIIFRVDNYLLNNINDYKSCTSASYINHSSWTIWPFIDLIASTCIYKSVIKLFEWSKLKLTQLFQVVYIFCIVALTSLDNGIKYDIYLAIEYL